MTALASLGYFLITFHVGHFNVLVFLSDSIFLKKQLPPGFPSLDMFKRHDNALNIFSRKRFNNKTTGVHAKEDIKWCIYVKGA